MESMTPVTGPYPVSVLLDGNEAAISSTRTASDVIGWRSACKCGWRGMQFYARREWPSPTCAALEGVDGWETGTAAFAEWESHLDRVLPELGVHDLARQLADIEERLRDAVHAARFTGVSWSRIGTVADTTADNARRQWGIADSPIGQRRLH